MEVIELVEEMQILCERLRQQGKRIRLIPTMGALHIGHGSLIEAATSEPLPLSREEDDHQNGEEENVTLRTDIYNNNNNRSKVGAINGQDTAAKESLVIIVSIFTNPMQFDRMTDFEKYPKTIEMDLEVCRGLGVNYVFMPSCEQIYPSTSDGKNSLPTSQHGLADHLSCCVVEPPTDLNNDLEGKSRKGHFRGMLTIVCKLFNITRAHEAYFGEKDYQQMVLVRRMVRDLNMSINIRPVATVRDPDMLPLSSRNVRLSEEERQAAPFMYKILEDARPILESIDINSNPSLDHILMSSLLSIRALASERDFKLVHVDYLQLRCSNDFSKVEYQHQEIKFFDCQEGCVRNQIQTGNGGLILKTRLLISCLVGENRMHGIRLLDNIEVKLNNNSSHFS